MPRDQIVLDTAGPLPKLTQFQAESDLPCSLVISATVYATAANSMVGVEVILDEQAIGEIRFFCNNADVHATLPLKRIPLQLGIGMHSIMLAKLTAATATDGNDYFQVVVDY
jgi:hypothetical protein